MNELRVLDSELGTTMCTKSVDHLRQDKLEPKPEVDSWLSISKLNSLQGLLTLEDLPS